MAISDTPRLALVGAASLLGKEVKEQLAAAGFPGTAIALLDLEEVAGLVTDYGEEARVLAEAAEAELLGHDVVCFCGNARLASEHVPKVVATGSVVIDCTGAFADDPAALLSLPAAGRAPDAAHGKTVVLPSAPTHLLAVTLALFKEPTNGSATVLVPASESGDPGVEELARQSAAILNLEEPPAEIFGRQLAFDVWLHRHGDQSPLAERVMAQLERLGLPALPVCLLQAPVFHSLSAAIHLRDIDTADLVERLLDAGVPTVEGQSAPEDAVDSPVRTAGAAGLRIGGVWADRHAGSWIWATMDNLTARASAAVATIQALLPSH